MVTKGGNLMLPSIPGHSNTLLSLTSCHMPAEVLEALVLTLKKGGNPIWPEVKEQVWGCLLAVCGLSGWPEAALAEQHWSGLSYSSAVPWRATGAPSPAPRSHRCQR